jgi:spermidine/putrescine transport system substrate-binding protein
MAHPRERSPFDRSMSRRDFLRRSAGTAFALSSAGAFLAACGHASNPNFVPSAGPTGSSGGTPSPTGLPFPLARRDNPVTWPIYDDNPPIAAGLQPETNATLKIYNWEDYLWPRIAKNFGKEFDCKVEISTFPDYQTGIATIQSAQIDYDVYFPDPSILGKLIYGKLIKPLTLDYIPNLKNQWTQLQSPFYDVGSRYSVPYTIYTTGVAWRNDKVSEDIPSMANPYEIMWDDKYKGKIRLLDDYRESLGMALLKNGLTDLNTEKVDDIELAKNDLLKMLDLVNVKLDVSDYTNIPEGVSWINQAWSGDMISAQYYLAAGVSTDDLSYWYPPQGGGAVGSDNIVVLNTGKNPVLVHLFLNYMLDKTNAFDNFYNFVGYQPPQSNINPDSLVSDEVIPKNLATTVVRPEDFDNGYTYLELSPTGDALWNSAFQEFSAGA